MTSVRPVPPHGHLLSISSSHRGVHDESVQQCDIDDGGVYRLILKARAGRIVLLMRYVRLSCLDTYPRRQGHGLCGEPSSQPRCRESTGRAANGEPTESASRLGPAQGP